MLRVILVALAAAGFWPAAAAETQPFPVKIGGPFSLIDEDGSRRTDGDFRGRSMLVFFGYTHCPSVCGIGLSEMAAAMDALGDDADRVQPVFITVDPSRDRPAVLKAYTDKFHPRLIGLTGSEAEISGVAKHYRIHRRKVLVPGNDDDDYLAMHTSMMYLMGPDGGFSTLFPLGTAPEKIAGAVLRK